MIAMPSNLNQKRIWKTFNVYDEDVLCSDLLIHIVSQVIFEERSEERTNIMMQNQNHTMSFNVMTQKQDHKMLFNVFKLNMLWINHWLQFELNSAHID